MQTAANRARLVPALAGVMGELEEQCAAAERRAAEEEEVKAWIWVRLRTGVHVLPWLLGGAVYMCVCWQGWLACCSWPEDSSDAGL